MFLLRLRLWTQLCFEGEAPQGRIALWDAFLVRLRILLTSWDRIGLTFKYFRKLELNNVQQGSWCGVHGKWFTCHDLLFFGIIMNLIESR